MKLPPLKKYWSLLALAGTFVLMAAVSGSQPEKSNSATEGPAPRPNAQSEAERPPAGNLRLPLEKLTSQTPFLWINDLSEPEHLFDIPGIGIPFTGPKSNEAVSPSACSGWRTYGRCA